MKRKRALLYEEELKYELQRIEEDIKKLEEEKRKIQEKILLYHQYIFLEECREILEQPKFKYIHGRMIKECRTIRNIMRCTPYSLKRMRGFGDRAVSEFTEFRKEVDAIVHKYPRELVESVYTAE